MLARQLLQRMVFQMSTYHNRKKKRSRKYLPENCKKQHPVRFFEICTFFLGNTRNFPKKGLFFLIALLAQTRGMTIFSGFIETWNCEYDDFQVPPPPPHRIVQVKVALLSSNGTLKRKRKSFTAYMNFQLRYNVCFRENEMMSSSRKYFS